MNYYSYRNLMNMRKFYILFKNEKMNALRSQLSWSHYKKLLVLNNMDVINHYISIAISKSLSYRELAKIIKFKEYERLAEYTKNELIMEYCSDERIKIREYLIIS